MEGRGRGGREEAMNGDGGVGGRGIGSSRRGGGGVISVLDSSSSSCAVVGTGIGGKEVWNKDDGTNPEGPVRDVGGVDDREEEVCGREICRCVSLEVENVPIDEVICCWW